MQVEYSGWTAERGPFRHMIYVDENKKDYAIHFSSGTVARQSSAFENHTADWNNDGDVYTMFGAWFDYLDKDGSRNGGAFHTPEDLVRFAVEAADPEQRSYGTYATKVEGIEFPPPDRRSSLNDRIAQSENRAMQQEAERNRKMDMLGVRRPGEPWAR